MIQKIQSALLTPCSLLLLVCLFGFLPKAASQSRRAYERAGDKAMEQKNYGTALQHYNTALGRKPTDPALMWKCAESARKIHAYPLAEKMYRSLEGLENAKGVSPLLLLHLGEVVKNQGRYDEAVPIFERFLEQQPAADLADRARAEIAACRWAVQHAQDDAGGVEVTNAGKTINSPYSDFVPFAIGDTLYFSSY